MTTAMTGPALLSGEVVIPIWRSSNLIGRIDPISNATPDIDLAELDGRRSVSRRHARIDFKGRSARLRDLGSTNGTFVNEVRLSPQRERELADGDRIRFGRVELAYTSVAGWPDGVVAEWDAGTVQMADSEEADVARMTPSSGDFERTVATVMFTDITDSTVRAASLGDRAWRDLLLAHRDVVRWQLQRFEGKELKTTGDGFLAIFDSPARAVRCGCAIAGEVRELGIEVRVGLHTGECDFSADDVGGIAVHIASRVASKAGPSEVLVSTTVHDLVVGSGLPFLDFGLRTLKGVPGRWRLYAVDQEHLGA